MKRLFKEHEIRNVIDLNGNWLFLTDPDNKGEENGWQAKLPSEAKTVIIPSLWNNELGLLCYTGKAWYEKQFKTQGGTLRLEFGSVMTEADVWLDGKYVGNHYGAFTQFEFILNGIEAGEHTLVVRADTTKDKKSFPQEYTDWHNYGGIARDVEAQELKGITILSNHIVYELSDDFKNATLHAELEVYNADNQEASSELSITVGDFTIYNGNVTVKAGEKQAIKTPDYEIKDAKIWDPATPNLYTVVAKTETDDLIDRVGFRRIETRGNDIYLNGKSILLLGVNRHEEHPEWGFAFPPKLMRKDLDIIRDLGCNTIRGSHYPNSRIFMDMLDEDGMLFWCEIPMWGVGFGKDVLADPDVSGRGFNMIKEMAKYYYNHPSIIIWGMHNEVDTRLDVVYEFTKTYRAHLKEFGGNRLLTHASNVPFEDKCMELDDIISMNLYKGWYSGSVEDWDKFVIEFKEHLEKIGVYGRPVLMSEFGAGALYGYHSAFDTLRWSEEFQRDLLEHCLELFLNCEYMRGTYIWQFCNIRTSPTLDLNRVRCFNNKGILDEYRNPKAAYFKVKEIYEKYGKKGTSC